MPNTIRRCISVSPVTFTTLYDESVSARLIINPQTGTTYTLVLADENKLVTMTNASAIALTVPASATVAFPIGAQVHLAQLGTGKVTVGGTGAAVVDGTPALGFRDQWSAATLIKYATDNWLLVGDLG